MVGHVREQLVRVIREVADRDFPQAAQFSGFEADTRRRGRADLRGFAGRASNSQRCHDDLIWKTRVRLFQLDVEPSFAQDAAGEVDDEFAIGPFPVLDTLAAHVSGDEILERR